ncbi:MAG: hypothetical protein M3P06_11375 [Acidobacteriota bacterium]|nr:hypothetical protein [Acidobacteriota bacterium]
MIAYKTCACDGVFCDSDDDRECPSLTSVTRKEAMAVDPTKLQRRIMRLERELRRQWEVNHDEHCGKKIMPKALPHEGECYWPLPKVMEA